MRFLLTAAKREGRKGAGHFKATRPNILSVGNGNEQFIESLERAG